MSQPNDSQGSFTGSTMSEVNAGPRISQMLNNITSCSVENAEHLLTSLEISIYDGRAAFISTFINRRATPPQLHSAAPALDQGRLSPIQETAALGGG